MFSRFRIWCFHHTTCIFQKCWSTYLLESKRQSRFRLWYLVWAPRSRRIWSVRPSHNLTPISIANSKFWWSDSHEILHMVRQLWCGGMGKMLYHAIGAAIEIKFPSNSNNKNVFKKCWPTGVLKGASSHPCLQSGESHCFSGLSEYCSKIVSGIKWAFVQQIISGSWHATVRRHHAMLTDQTLWPLLLRKLTCD